MASNIKCTKCNGHGRIYFQPHNHLFIKPLTVGDYKSRECTTCLGKGTVVMKINIKGKNTNEEQPQK